jgi:uncharacterized protein YndB with AHSA1/START domain
MGTEYGSIERELHVDATPDVVFEVLTKPEHIAQWWSAQSEFARTGGATGTLSWTNDDTGERHTSPFTVVDVDPPRRFSFRWTYDDGVDVGAGDSLLVTFELMPSGEGTTLRFRESGFRERGWEAAVLEAYYNDHRQGWDFYLPRLADVAARLAARR